MKLNKKFLKIGIVLCGIIAILVGVYPWINNIFNASEEAILVIYEPVFYFPLLLMLVVANVLNLIAVVRQNKEPKTKWSKNLTVQSLGILMVSLSFAVVYPLTREAFGMILAGDVALLIVIIESVLSWVGKGFRCVPQVKALLCCAILGLVGSIWFVGYSLDVDYDVNFRMISETQSLDSIHAQHSEVARGLSNGVVALCDGDYKVVYMGQGDGNYGVFKCVDDNHTYYFVQQLDGAEADYGIRVYGVAKNTMIEKVFAGKNYLFRDTVHENGLMTLNIALEAETEDEFVERYTHDFYELIQALRSYSHAESDGDLDLGILVFANSKLDATNEDEDRLFLLTHMLRDDLKIEREYGGKYYNYWACAELATGCALLSSELGLDDEDKAALSEGVMVLRVKDAPGAEITEDNVRQLLHDAYVERSNDG